MIECNIRQLSAGDRIQVEISAVVDERYLGVSIHTHCFIDIFMFYSIESMDLSSFSWAVPIA